MTSSLTLRPVAPTVRAGAVPAPGPVARPAPGTRPAFVTGGAVLAIAAFVVIHLQMAAVIDPRTATLSTYGVHTASAGLFATGCLLLAGACATLATALRAPGRAAAHASAALLTLVVVFPTDAGPGALSLSAQLHRYAAGAAFATLTLTVASGRRACRDRRTRALLLALLAVAAAALALTVVGTFRPSVLSVGDWRGIPQRVLLLDYATAVAVLGGRPSRE